MLYLDITQPGSLARGTPDTPRAEDPHVCSRGRQRFDICCQPATTLGEGSVVVVKVYKLRLLS